MSSRMIFGVSLGLLLPQLLSLLHLLLVHVPLCSYTRHSLSPCHFLFLIEMSCFACHFILLFYGLCLLFSPKNAAPANHCPERSARRSRVLTRGCWVCIGDAPLQTQRRLPPHKEWKGSTVYRLCASYTFFLSFLIGYNRARCVGVGLNLLQNFWSLTHSSLRSARSIASNHTNVYTFYF